MSAEVLAATRDASWHHSPGRAVRFHLVRDAGPYAMCGRRSFLDVDYAIRATSVAHDLRCKRCKPWPL